MSVKHEPVQPYLIRPKMERLLEGYRNNTDHIIPRLARFHIEFEGIHPFIDGNVTRRYDSPVGDKDDKMRRFLTEAGYQKFLESKERGEVKLKNHAKVSCGHLHYDRRDRVL